jgi:hypothetical protein
MNTYNANELLNDDTIKIPEHQRPEMWSTKKQERLIDTIMNRRPMPSLAFRETIDSGKKTRWLEDGHQRYISMKKFYENRLAWNGKLYSDFNDTERFTFLLYKVFVLSYENASYDDTIAIFDTFQCGVALTPGQRFHARMETPLVKYARERILTPGMYFYDRASEVWGAHKSTDDTKTKKNLMNAMAIAGGLAHGIEFITTSYDILGPKLNDAFDIEAADTLLDKVIGVFEGADAIYQITHVDKKKQWDAGRLIGYILYSLIQFPNREDEIIDRWTEYIVNVREGTDTLSILHHNMPPSRNWNSTRWSIGYKNIFEVRPNINILEEVGESEDED